MNHPNLKACLLYLFPLTFDRKHTESSVLVFVSGSPDGLESLGLALFCLVHLLTHLSWETVWKQVLYEALHLGGFFSHGSPALSHLRKAMPTECREVEE